MKKEKRCLLKCLKNIQPYTYVFIGILCLFLLLAITCYTIAWQRAALAVVDFGLGLATYFVFLTEPLWEFCLGYIPQIPTRFRDIPNVSIDAILPFSINDFFVKIRSFGPNFFNFECFLGYNIMLLQMLYLLFLYGMLLLLTGMFFFIVVRNDLLMDQGNLLGSFTKPLEVFLRLWRRFIFPVSKFIRGLIDYFKQHKKLLAILFIIYLINVNAFTVGIELMAYFLYFVSTLDIVSIPSTLLRLLVDLLILFFSVPWWLWLVVSVTIYVFYCFSKGYDKLRYFDAKNCGYLKTISYVSLLIGAPGVGKTTLLTSFCLYFVNIFKRDSLDTLFDVEMIFPAFPFSVFRKELDDRITSGVIKDNATAEMYVNVLQAAYERTPASCLLFGYDAELFPLERDMGNRMETLFGALRTYAQAYFIYVCENPSISNYPIRFDGKFDDSKYLRRWDGDFYKRKPREQKERSRYSHILDQDILRMGKMMDPSNPKRGMFCFGIWSNTEWGKARGNQLTTADVDKSDELANQKNDLYSYSLKLSRHAKTMVANKCYFRFLGDEQRPESLAVDQRDLCDIISIAEKSELRLALPHFEWLDKLYDKVYEPFKDFYFDYASARGDMCLTMFLMKIAVGAFSHMYKWIYNRFGYYTIKLMKQKGTAYGNAKGTAPEPEYIDYYLPVMQVYSDRYSTDCYSGFFTKAQLDCAIGINDLECFTGKTMNTEQMVSQHDYFLRDIMKVMQKQYGDVSSEQEKTFVSAHKERVHSFEAQEF